MASSIPAKGKREIEAAPGRRRRRVTITVVVGAAVMVAAVGVAALWAGHHDNIACGPASRGLCLVGQPYAFIDGSPASHDQVLRPGQSVTLQEDLQAYQSKAPLDTVEIWSGGSTVRLERGGEVAVADGGGLSLRSGRIWVSASPSLRVSVAGSHPTDVDIAGAALVDTRTGAPVVTVRSGQAVVTLTNLQHGLANTVRALQTGGVAADGQFTPITPYAPDTIADPWVSELPPPGNDPADPLAATVSGTYQVDLTVQTTDTNYTRAGDVSHRRLTLTRDCTNKPCTLTATTDQASGPVTFDGTTYHAAVKSSVSCGIVAGDQATQTLAFTPTDTSRQSAWPSAVALTGTWMRHYDCVGGNFTFAVKATTSTLDPMAFPTRDEEHALTFLHVPWSQCQRRVPQGFASAAVSCTGSAGIASINATQYKDRPSLDAAYNARVAASGVAPGSTNDATGAREGPFVNGAAGRQLAYINPGGQAVIVDTNTGAAVLDDWVGTSGDLAALASARATQLG